MNKIKILLTAIGSMSASTIVKSLKQQGIILYGCDIYHKEWHPLAKELNELFQVPKARQENYINSLLTICSNEKIDYVFPLTDVEIDVLVEYINDFDKINTVICFPGKKTIEISRDKFNLFNFFSDNEKVKVIPTYKDIKHVKFPIIAKPQNGRSSEGIIKIESLGDLPKNLSQRLDYIFQPIINGSIYTVDYIRQKDGIDYSLARKELIRTSNGAGISVEIIEDKKLVNLASEIGNKLDIKGCVNMEFIHNNNDFYLMDINPRFSAGVGFSFLAGYNFPVEHLKVFMNMDIVLNIKPKKGFYAKQYIDVKLS